MPVFCDHLRRFPDPWDRTTAEIKYQRDLAAGRRRAQATQFSEPAFDEWFELVTDPVHAEAERRNYGTACAVARQIHEHRESEQREKEASRHDSK